MALTWQERFESYFDRTLGCWEWQGLRNRHGYARFGSGKQRTHFAHRLAYELYVGPVPEGHEVDHLCSNRACVNPAHLEAVTRGENVRRTVSRGLHGSGNTYKTHCKRGHAFDTRNTYVTKEGHRRCRACNRRSAHRRRVVV